MSFRRNHNRWNPIHAIVSRRQGSKNNVIPPIYVFWPEIVEKALQVQSKYNTNMVMEFTFISMSLEILNTNNDYQKIACLVYICG